MRISRGLCVRAGKIFLLAALIIGTGIVTVERGGKDLKVGLFGVTRAFRGESPYDNPTDPARPLFRYAPGFAVMQAPFMLFSTEVAPFVFRGIRLSIIAWYLFEIACLFGIAFILPRLIPGKMPARSLQLSFLLASPYILYELANCQNKIPALFFMVLALLLFERRRFFTSALSFCAALTIYIPLVFFLAYFLIEGGRRYVFRFLPAVVIVFIAIPSVFWGTKTTFILLGEWYERCIRPFATGADASRWVDIRRSSMSLSSALAKLFVSGGDQHVFRYAIPPGALHAAVQMAGAVVTVFAVLSAWMRRNTTTKGLVYSGFFILALLIPQYCIYYTWSWMLFLFFAVFSYQGFADARLRRLSRFLLVMLSAAGFLMAIPAVKRCSLLSWGTLVFLLGIAFVVMSEPRRRRTTAGAARVDRISVVLIAHNEQENIGAMLSGLVGQYDHRIKEIIVVDDSSTDRTVAVVESFMRGCRKVVLAHCAAPGGVGRAIRTGFERVSDDAEYVLSMDSDFVDSIADVGPMIRCVEEQGCDGVIGSRFVPGSVMIRYPRMKKIMNRLFHCLARFFFGIRTHDLTNNFKLYRRNIVKTLPWKSDGFSINAETGLLPIISGFRIEEVPVAWIGRSGQMGVSKFRLFRNGWAYAKVLAYARKLDSAM